MTQKWEVQTHTFCDGWSNIWKIQNDDGEMVPEYFYSEGDANLAIEEEIKEQEQMYALEDTEDERSEPDSIEDYRVVAVEVEE